MSTVKSDEFIQSANELEDFMKLTSDKVIREAAYPEAEWIENGGGKGNGFLSGYLNSYSAVSIQDNPPDINLQGGLLSPHSTEPVKQDLTKRAVNIAHHWQNVKAHPCYRRFHGYAYNRLNEAVQLFKDKTNLKSAADALKSDLALLRFYHLFAQYIEAYLLYDKFGYRQKYADAKVLKQAKGHVEKLQEDFGQGLRLNNNHYQLEALLKQLSIEIDQAPRKDRETPTAAKRRVLENFAYISILEFGEASATILGYFAEILGWNKLSNSTMDEVVANAKKKHQLFIEKLERESYSQSKKLAEALRLPPSIIAKK